ncbi:DUF1798 family protein [Staphylococcus delphini]|uniref:DUF1798 family protein n=1 Tax=Staphylococcus delphini TaxID=53344 RepID=UPI0012D34F23|nr:DUF1798 family protein [Staphylococcus delphini]MTV22574.1 DUF1798 family protein [Staphylococcus delphini]UXS43249.1 YppE family protein [Staphylococcus delphini]UXV43943.1 YppE family protein [Staphylococcus delphini]
MQIVIQQLIHDLATISQRYETARSGKQYDFYKEAQPFVQQVDAHLQSLHHYQDTISKQKYFNARKLQRMSSLMAELAVACHQSTTSKKLFLDQFKAVQHDLNYLSQLEGDEHV